MTFLTKLLGRPKREKPDPTHPPSRATSPLTPSQADTEVQEAMLLRGLTDPTEYEYRRSIHTGDMVDVLDGEGKWRLAEVTKDNSTHLHVRFVDSQKAFNLALHRGGGKIAHPLTRSAGATHLRVQPTMASPPSMAPPLTPWSPSTVDYSIGPTCILHQPPPPLLTPASPGTMSVIPMARDNSCLYHAIAYVCEGKQPRKGLHVMQQRLRAHSLVKADPETYNSVVLGSDVETYCKRLLNLSTWGGAIELGLYSSLYEVEIFAFDFTQPTVYRFGDEHGHKKRVFLVYSGSHYEALGYVEGGNIQEFFDSTDDEALSRAQRAVEALYMAKGKGKKGGEGGVVWAGEGVYELKRKAKQFVSRILSPRNRSPPPAPSVNTALPRMQSISVPTPLSAHARRSSFTFGVTGKGVGLQSPPVLPRHPHSFPGEVGRGGVR